MVLEEEQVRDFWNFLFCNYYGKLRPPTWSIFRCFDCKQKPHCRQKLDQDLSKLIKEFGDFSKIPMEDLIALGYYAKETNI